MSGLGNWCSNILTYYSHTGGFSTGLSSFCFCVQMPVDFSSIAVSSLGVCCHSTAPQQSNHALSWHCSLDSYSSLLHVHALSSCGASEMKKISGCTWQLMILHQCVAFNGRLHPCGRSPWIRHQGNRGAPDPLFSSYFGDQGSPPDPCSWHVA